jgi:hypothetical protein
MSRVAMLGVGVAVCMGCLLVGSTGLVATLVLRLQPKEPDVTRQGDET